MHVQTFGRLELVAAKTDLSQPIYLILPDSGKSVIRVTPLLMIGIKLKFEEKHQTLVAIEIYLEGVKKRIGYLLSREALLG